VVESELNLYSCRYVWELPGGSSWSETDSKKIALEEVHEEVGLTIDPSRLVHHRSRQINATMSAHM
jgi:8-oxo-dGTP pyrophosphatase MutT (NUDIX family)